MDRPTAQDSSHSEPGSTTVQDVKRYIEDLVAQVADDLIRIYPRSSQSSVHGLIFPRKRNGSLRVSEQEAKLLFVRHLTADGRFFFAVETPTSQTYRQSGSTDMSARVDLTLFGKDRLPAAHIELKAHNCAVESIRKDLEKLVREQTTGVWFHTLERADGRTLRVLMDKFNEAFTLLTGNLKDSDIACLICFCVLAEGLLLWRWIQFAGRFNDNLRLVQDFFDERGFSSGLWATRRFGVDTTGPQPTAIAASQETKGTSTGKGAREGFFVFAPTIASDTFVHLSARGGSYRIRNYHQSGPSEAPRSFKVPGYPTLDALKGSGLILRWWPVTTEDLLHNIDLEPGYWFDRINQISRSGLPLPAPR